MISVAVMAHPTRARWYPYLQRKLPTATLIIDNGWNDRHRTGLEALKAHNPAATHHLIIQDDAVICDDLTPAAEHVATQAGDRIVSLYTGNVRQTHPSHSVSRQVAASNGSRWVEADGPRWGVALLIPTPFIGDLAAWFEQSPIRNYDRRIFAWNRLANGGVCWYTAPSLVDHRTIARHGNVSLIPRRVNRNRRAVAFIGAHKSALDLWP